MSPTSCQLLHAAIYGAFSSPMVPVTGLEPVRYHYRGILSPLCLPIPPHRRASAMIRIAHLLLAVKSFLPKPAKIYFISLRRFSPYFFQAPAYDRESAHAKEETQYGRHHPPRRRGRPDLPGGVDRQPALGGLPELVSPGGDEPFCCETARQNGASPPPAAGLKASAYSARQITPPPTTASPR